MNPTVDALIDLDRMVTRLDESNARLRATAAAVAADLRRIAGERQMEPLARADLITLADRLDAGRTTSAHPEPRGPVADSSPVTELARTGAGSKGNPAPVEGEA